MKLHSSPDNGVCVIIAAKNASGTIARAIRSALREAEVREVVVVDDGSSDDTASVASAADDGTGRLKVLSLPQNRGPSFARNHAIEQSTSPLLAILDADDFLLPGRFARLLDADDWDFVADNIVFIDERDIREADPKIVEFAPEPRFLDLKQFVEGNISIRGKQRGEIGFLKPVMRRAFLDEHGLRYREELRLGEDYELYARALALGARYKIVHGCGYGAVVRGDSLSGRHRTVDLQRLYEADRAILELPNIPASAADALHAHESSIRDRYELRAFLDVKAQSGLNAAAKYALANASALPAIVKGIFADKFDAWRKRGKPADTAAEPRALRYLLPGTPLN
ncbi:glycosyltransferase family 2 protein [Mesorhizobium sp. SB112]|uniref:glycosyltransferase family 2 protein n=1 Tax=Mesorhizobium sp. SB112 TaxID=3151853 RepID=UPI0032674E6D